MTAFLLVIHVMICIGLITIVLIQRGRGGGFVESFSGLDSMFGTKTSAFLTKTTTVLSIFFFLTCLSLAAISLRNSRSLINKNRQHKAVEQQQQPQAAQQAVPQSVPGQSQPSSPGTVPAPAK